jgi:Ser/Thr protein kinase RdoA (MazF antagonist)
MSQLNQEDQINLNYEVIEDILLRYYIVLKNYQKTKHGISNQTILVQSHNDSEYVLKIFRKFKNKQSIQDELNFVEYLNINELTVPELVQTTKNQNYLVYNHDGFDWIVIVMQKSIGQHQTWDTIDDNLLINIATNHAKLHNLGQQYWEDYGDKQNLQDFEILKHGLGKTVDELRNNDFGEYTNESRIQKLLTTIRNSSPTLPSSLPIGFIHGDFDETNFLVQDNKISCILDFDDLRQEPIINCLSVILFSIIKFNKTPKNTLKKYLTQYQLTRTLNKLEIDNLSIAITLTGYFYFLWEMNTNRNQKDILKCIDDIDTIELIMASVV